MRPLVFLAVLVVLVLLSDRSEAQSDSEVVVFAFQDMSCGTWVKSVDNEAARAQYHSWFRGFVSGYNFGNSSNQVALDRIPDSNTLDLYVDKYCRENPLKPFVGAAFELVRELRDRR